MTPSLPGATCYRIVFVEQPAAGQAVLVEFAGPKPVRAVRVVLAPGAEVAGDGGFDVLCVPGQASAVDLADATLQWVALANHPAGEPPLTLTLHGTQVVWGAGRAALLAAPERLEALLLALVDFAYHERELGGLERIVAASWAQLEADSPLAFEVTRRDVLRQGEVAQQAERLLAVRRTLVRLAPRLNRPVAHPASLAHQLGERLRERARVEARLEALGAQLDAFEHVYEMVAQRFSEYRLSWQERTLEWVIIVLLAAEVVLLLLDYLKSLER
jgi:hypothetical protein